MTASGGMEWLLLFFFTFLPILIVVYIVVLLRDIRKGIRGLNDRTEAIERRLEHEAIDRG